MVKSKIKKVFKNLKPVPLGTILDYQTFYLETTDSFLVEYRKTSFKSSNGYIYVADINAQEKIYLNPSQIVYIP